MADITNLNKFLTDVADAIRVKKETEELIAAEDFDTEILSIEGGVDTSDATATENDIISPKTAYVNGEKVTGAIIPEFKNTGMPVISEQTLNNSSGLNITSINYVHKIAVVSVGNNARVYRVKDDGTIDTTTYAEILLSQVTGDSTTTRALNYSAIAHNCIRENVVNICLLANSKGNWLNVIPIGVCEINLKTLTVEKVNKMTATGMGPYQWFGGNIYPRPNSADCFALGFSGQSNGACQQYVGVGRNPATNTYAVTFSYFSDWQYNQRTTTHTHWSDDGRYCYMTHNKLNRLLRVSDDGYTWTSVAANDLNVPIPLNSSLAILGNTLYDPSTNVAIGTAPNSLSITAATENYYVSNGYLFILKSNKLETYSVNGTEITYLGQFANIGTLKLFDGVYQHITLSTSGTNITSLIDTVNVEKVITALTMGENFTYYNTNTGNAESQHIVTGKTAYNINGEVRGTMRDNGAKVITPGDSQIAIPSGYHNGNGYVKATNIANLQEYKDCEIIADAILEGSPLHSELQYFTMSGTQYVDPQVTVDSNYILEIKYLLTGSNTGMGRMFGGGSDMNFEMAASGTTQFRWAINGTGTNVSFTSGAAHVFKCHGNGLCYIDGVQKANLAKNQNSTKLWLFDNFSHKEHAKGTFYYCKIWNGSILVRDFIPVQNTSGEVCLYDKISKTYFKNAGTGVFTAGPVV